MNYDSKKFNTAYDASLFVKNELNRYKTPYKKAHLKKDGDQWCAYLFECEKDYKDFVQKYINKGE